MNITDKSQRYNMSLSRNQLRVINVALETYFRVLMGQHFDLATEVALNGYEYNPEDPDNSRKFDDYIERRNEAQDLYDKAFRVANPNLNAVKKTPDMRTAIDIWHVIRHQFYLERPEPKDHWTVDSTVPFQIAEEPLPKIEVGEHCNK